MNTGHDGSMGTLHANNPREALSRLESMIIMGGFSLPSRTIREMICASVDVVIQSARLRDGSRKITHVTEVMGMEGDVIVTQDIFLYDMEGEDAKGNIIGRPACSKLYERTPLPEANFFGIVVAIQQKAGGNLSEALGNLSKVLRDRKKMRAKSQAMSQEAKASAAIIGALPIAVMILVYLTAPQYITLLFTNSMGHIMLAGSAVWMTMGVLVMKKMINFDF